MRPPFETLPRSLTLALAVALALGGCRAPPPAAPSASDAGPRIEAARTATSTGAGKGGPSVAGAPIEPGAPGESAEPGEPGAANEPLRDPRERRLRDVRQLTHGKVVASPRFAADGKSILFLSRGEQGVALERVAVSGGVAELVNLGLPHGSAWALIDGRGGPCLVLTPPSCSLEPWPEPLGLVPCRSLSEIPTAPGIGCPSQPDKALPCVESVQGARACALPTEHGADIALSTKADLPDGGPTLLGPHGNLSFAPAFSADGAHLLYLSRTDDTVRLWVAPTAHPELTRAVGPEAHRAVDPIFVPAGAVMLASSIDDTAGQELDLDLLWLDPPALERVTFEPGIDRFPAFSPDGKLLAWVSERNADPGTSDLFVAKWNAEPDGGDFARQRK